MTQHEFDKQFPDAKKGQVVTVLIPFGTTYGTVAYYDNGYCCVTWRATLSEGRIIKSEEMTFEVVTF